MAIWTNPVSLSDDDGVTTDIDFSFLHQDTSSKDSIVGIWTEDTAEPTAESRLVIKHDQRVLSKGYRRDLLQLRSKLHPALDTETDDLQLLTLNLTITGDKRFSVAEISPRLYILVDAALQTNFLAGFRSGKI